MLLQAMRWSQRFTATAMVTLALGISAATTIFSVTNGVLLAPLLATERPHELLTFWGTAPEKRAFPSSISRADCSLPCWRSRAFVTMTAFRR